MDLAEKLKKADIDTIKEIIREAESYLQSQLTAAMAADQRALAFSGLLGAAAVVVAGSGGALLLANPPNLGLGWTCIGIAISFVVAMFFAIRSAQPANFEFFGNDPENWASDVQSGKALLDALSEQATHYSTMIQKNGDIMKKNASQMRFAIWIAWAGLAVGGIVAVGVLFCSTF
jgi:hypothetical protein